MLFYLNANFASLLGLLSSVRLDSCKYRKNEYPNYLAGRVWLNFTHFMNYKLNAIIR